MLGYYVHHQGSGHLTRAGIVAAACDEPVVGLSSLPEPPRPHPFAGWVRLAPDPEVAAPHEPDAGGALHWAPLNSPGYRQRMHRLVQWCAATRPSAVVVDLSVEVAALLRLAAVPVVVVTLPGRRDDAAHELAYRLAALVVAPWPREVYDPPHLHPFAARTVYAGALSRFDTVPAPADVPLPPTRRLVVLAGSGGGGAMGPAGAPAGWTVHPLGPGSWSADVHRELASATLVVTHAGSNALAEVAALRRPAVVVPQERPFGEQHATAEALDAAGIAVAAPHWPGSAELPSLIEVALRRGGAGWGRWNDGQGAGRIATAVREVTRP